MNFKATLIVQSKVKVCTA